LWYVYHIHRVEQVSLSNQAKLVLLNVDVWFNDIGGDS